MVKDEFSRIYAENGGVGYNAFTSKDLTTYLISLPANKLELWAAIEADRMQNAVLREFYSERDVVMEERRYRIDNHPQGRLYEQLLVSVLAVLKAGGSYTWNDPDCPEASPVSVSFLVGRVGNEDRYLHVELTGVLAERIVSSPNLPVVTRGSDIACILRDQNGLAGVMVPHATIAALHARTLPQRTPWLREPGAFDLWIALMSGATAVVEDQPATVAA